MGRRRSRPALDWVGEISGWRWVTRAGFTFFLVKGLLWLAALVMVYILG